MSFFCLVQALTIIAFNHGSINLDTFKTILSIGPSFAIMNFIKSKLLSFLVGLIFWMKSNFRFLFVSISLLRCSAYIWSILYCKRHGCFKNSYTVFLGWLELCVCDISLCVSFYLLQDISLCVLDLTVYLNGTIAGRFCRREMIVVQIIHYISGYTF